MTVNLCRGHMERIMTSDCTDVNTRSKGKTMMMICAPVEQTQLRTAVGSNGCDHEKAVTH
jgi:hypothetical protein